MLQHHLDVLIKAYESGSFQLEKNRVRAGAVDANAADNDPVSNDAMDYDDDDSSYIGNSDSIVELDPDTSGIETGKFWS